MIGRVAAPSILLLSVMATVSTAEVLHTLVSPNEGENGWFGYSVSGAGDVNEDCYCDVVVGASHESPGSSPLAAGRAYPYSWMNLSSRATP